MTSDSLDSVCKETFDICISCTGNIQLLIHFLCLSYQKDDKSITSYYIQHQHRRSPMNFICLFLIVLINNLCYQFHTMPMTFLSSFSQRTFFNCHQFLPNLNTNGTATAPDITIQCAGCHFQSCYDLTFNCTTMHNWQGNVWLSSQI